MAPPRLSQSNGSHSHGGSRDQRIDSQNSFAHFVAKTEILCYKFLFVGLTPRRPGGVPIGMRRKDEIDLIARRGNKMGQNFLFESAATH